MLNRNKAKKFINNNKTSQLYQPVIFQQEVLELEGKWHEATLELCDIVLNDIHNKSVLDIGCNIGFFIHESLKKGAKKAVGIDHDIITINKAKEISSILNNNAIFINEDICLYTPEHKFDLILLFALYPEPDNFEDILQRYLSYTNKNLFLERDYNKDTYDSSIIYNRFPSPRCAGQREVIHFQVQ